jgi:hypothetical protein
LQRVGKREKKIEWTGQGMSEGVGDEDVENAPPPPAENERPGARAMSLDEKAIGSFVELTKQVAIVSAGVAVIVGLSYIGILLFLPEHG